MDPIKQAIARIKVGGSRGTGFLVTADGLVLTAMHVIADLAACRKKRVFEPYRGEIQLRFGDPANPPTWEAKATPVPPLWSLEDDWVVLALDRAPQAKPLAVATLAGAPAGATWTSFGFPDLASEDGTPYDGRFVDASQRAVLYSDQVAGAEGSKIKGLSGAPCIVGGEVVAIIQQALLDAQDRAQEGKLMALDVARAVSNCNGRIPWAKAEKLPFEAELLEALANRDAYFDRAAKALQVPPERATREAIARGMLQRGIDAASTALGIFGIKQGPAATLVEYVGAMSLYHEAAEVLGRVLSRAEPDAVGAVIRATENEIVKWYIRRARYGDLGPNKMLNRTVEVEVSTQQEGARGQEETPAPGAPAAAPRAEDIGPSVLALKAEIEKAVRAKWPEQASRFLANAPVWNEKNYFGVLVRGETRPEVFRKISDDLPGARFVVATAEPLAEPARTTILDYAAPDVDASYEEELISDYRQALDDLMESP